jgi:hypothetical protein
VTLRSFFGLGHHALAPTRPTLPGGARTPATAGAPSPHLSPPVTTWVKRSRFDPIRLLSPPSLSRVMDPFANGCLREFAQLAHAIKNRDDLTSAALGQREKAVAGHGFFQPFQPKSNLIDDNRR